MLFTKVDPGDLADTRTSYRSAGVSEIIERPPGYRFRYLLESVEHPGEIRSMTAWGTRAHAEAYERSPLCEELGRRARQWLTLPPRVNSYEVREA
jgi:heme-degrading monooxygenase HmoA